MFKIFKKFIKDNKGVGIVEYVILLSLLGTVVVTTTPVLREQVGQMYEEQVNSTNHLNGMIETQSSERFDLDTSTPFVRQPNGTVANPGGNTNTELTPIIPEKKNIIYNFKTTEIGEITDTYFYDDGQFDGVLFKTASPTTQRVLATRNVQLEKEATKVIQGTEAILLAQDTVIETDSEGYTGTLIATGEVEKYVTGTSPDSYIEIKQITTASPMISSIETTNSNASQLALEFPAEKYFEETQIISGVESQTGYKGTLSKYSTPVRTQLANVNITDVKPAVQNRTFGKTVDVTNSIIDKTYKYVSGQGLTSTNSMIYPTTYYYKDAIKEGLLNYVSKGSTLIDTQVDTKAVSVSPQSSSPLSATYNYNVSGYTGVLNAPAASYVASGSYTPSDTIYVTAQTSSNYNSGGYTGTLNSYIYSTYWTPADTIYVTAQTSSSYNSGGYSGSLSSYLYSGSYTPSDSRWEYTTKTGSSWTNYLCSNKVWSVSSTGQTDIQGTTYTYNSGGYTGTYSVTSVNYGTSYSGTQRSGACNTSGATDKFTQYNTVYLSAYVTKPASDTRTYRYQGNVTKPGYYTDVYRYQGNVTKPASDTRIWSRDYFGNVSKTTYTYEYFANYTGKIFDIQSRTPSPAPATINYTDGSGYSGILDKDILSETNTIVSLTSNAVTTNLTGYKLYTVGEFPSNTNTQTYPAIYNYDRGDGYKGNINYTGKSTEFAYSKREGQRMENQTTTSSTNSFVNTIPYNNSGFDGVLSKNGASYVVSGTYVPEQNKVETDFRVSTINTFSTSLPYSLNGYTGTLTKNGVSTVISGVYTPADTKPVTKKLFKSDLDCVEPTFDCESLFPTQAPYNVSGYTGNLDPSSNFYFEHNLGSDTDFARELVMRTFNENEAPTSRPTYSGYWTKVQTYEMERIHVYNKSSGLYSEGTYYSGVTTDAIWSSLGAMTSQGNNWTWDDYYNNRGGDATFTYNSNSWRKPYYITEWKWTRRMGYIYKDYAGNATKPSSDTREWQQNYSGTVIKPSTDNRIFGQNYTGEVSQLVNYYKHFGTYSGTLSKDFYNAQFEYKADYKGDISKVASVPNYRYDQKYIGTLEKANIAYEYGYERIYEGTLFKNVIDQDIEYTQEYAGEVTKK
jgi:Flp pilus assembly pilin Flp